MLQCITQFELIFMTTPRLYRCFGYGNNTAAEQNIGRDLGTWEHNKDYSISGVPG